MWHYLDQQRQTIGPVDASQIADLVQRGVLNGDSHVWYTGWPNWAPISLAWQSLGFAAAPAAARVPNLPNSGAAAGNVSVLAPGQNPWSLGGFANKVTDLVGLERIEGFRIGEMMSAVFKRYGDETIEAYFSVGLKETTPPLSQVTTKWPKPWMFARTLALALFLYFGFLIAVNYMNAPIAIPALIITGSFAVPLATVVFFFEMNAPQNVSLYQVLKLVLMGGVVSILFSLLLFNLTTFDDWLGPPSAGLIEELGKLAAVIFLTRKLEPQRYPYILNGLLFGAAVGAGFAAFESAGYAFMTMMEAQSSAAGNENIWLRGVLAPFGHVVWTAIAAGAVWSVKGANPVSFKMLLDRRVITLLGASMLLHFCWNLPMIGPFLLKFWLLGLIAWILVFALIQKGLRQLKAAREVTHTMTRGLSLAEVQAALKNRVNQIGRSGP